MACDKCAYCDNVDGLEWHHILPKSLGGPDEAFNLIRVCSGHHAIIHGLSSRGNIRDLTSTGIARAREGGMRWGVQSKITPAVLSDIFKDKQDGMSLEKIGKKHGYHRDTIQKVVSKWYEDLQGYAEEYEAKELQHNPMLLYSKHTEPALH